MSEAETSAVIDVGEQTVALTDPDAIATATRRIAVEELDRLLIGRSIDYAAWQKLNGRVQAIVAREMEIARRSRLTVWLPSEVSIASELAIAELLDQRALVLWIKLGKHIGRYVRRHAKALRWPITAAVRLVIAGDKWLTTTKTRRPR